MEIKNERFHDNGIFNYFNSNFIVIDKVIESRGLKKEHLTLDTSKSYGVRKA